MSQSTALNMMTFPLHGTRLIEASAGTGKTYTVAALYVRLVLGHGGEQGFHRPLMPPEILVMTFTDAATKELRARVRARLTETARVLLGETQAHNDDFLMQIHNAYAEPIARAEAAQRLKTAAEWMDEAAIFTIHGFCYRLLRQHAFESGSLFDTEITPSASDDEYQAACDYWRQFIVPFSREAALGLLGEKVTSPEALLNMAKPAMGHGQATISPAEHTAEYEQQVAELQRLEAAAREALAVEFEEVKLWFEAAVTEKWVSGKSYNAKSLPQRFDALKAFMAGKSCLQDKGLAKELDFLAYPGIRFNKSKESHFPGFKSAQLLAQVVEAYGQGIKLPLEPLLQHAGQWIGKRVEQLRQQNATLSFDDMIVRMQVALSQGERGERLAAAIRQQFPVAMVDEFQDTDILQYSIFNSIYRHPDVPNDSVGWFMVGDPKQAIYSFRNADIYTYLAAREKADAKYTLPKNFRSATKMVAATNQLFQMGNEQNPEQGVFMHQHIPFEKVQAQGRSEQLLVAGEEVAGLYSWQPDAYEKTLSGGVYTQQQAMHTANEIARLLNASEAGQAGFAKGDEFTPLRPRDVAVLVRNRNEADTIRRALAKKQVASVFFSEKSSVFETQEAQDLQLILDACAHPEDSRKVRSALACQSLAQPLSELMALFVEEDDSGNALVQEQKWDQTLERFQRYRELWQQRGVLVMFHALLQEYQVPQRLAKAQNERALVNLRHLAELAQRAAAQLDGEQAVLRWLNDAIHNAESEGENQLRLESDADRVQVITIHKSKGLEFPLVFLPFICAYRETSAGKSGRYVVDGQPQHALVLTKETASLADQERLAEDMRLLYVAITRAGHACWLGLAPVVSGNAKENKVQLSAMGRLLFGEAGVATAQFVEQLIERTQAFLTLMPLPEDAAPYAPQTADVTLQPPLRSSFTAENPGWWIGNYSALKTARPYVPAQASSLDDESHELEPTQGELEGIHAFPRGPEPGNFLHYLLEQAAETGFSNQLAALQNAPERQIERLQRWLQNYGWEAHTDALYQQWQAWLSTPLLLGEGAQVPLAQVQTHLAEMEFWFPSQAVTAAELDALLASNVMPEQPLGGERPPFLENQLYGMFKGYIDLVFEHQGRFYVLDYKSNWLGPDASAYTREAMETAILKYRYEAQYSFYLLALHKLLKARLGENYDPEQHLGGAVYVFLRGTENPDTHGCYFHRPEQALIEKLDAIFTHDAKGGSHVA